MNEVKKTQQHILRAMAMNYAEGHAWDRLDSEACAKAADEIAAIEAECERLRGAMMEVVTKNFAKNLRRAAKDKELDYYLSEGIRKLQAERDAMAAQLGGANERAGLLLDAKNHWAERARKAEAELAAIKGQSGFDYSIRTQSTNRIPVPSQEIHFNSKDQLPPVDTPLLVLFDNQVVRARRPNFVERKGADLEFILVDGRTISGRLPWTYP